MTVEDLKIWWRWGKQVLAQGLLMKMSPLSQTCKHGVMINIFVVLAGAAGRQMKPHALNFSEMAS